MNRDAHKMPTQTLAAELLKFFHIDLSGQSGSHRIKTIEDFSNLKPEWPQTLDLNIVFRICAQLEHHGYLFEAASTHSHPILGKSYVAPNFDSQRAQYGEYDFISDGFGLVVKKLGPAVRPVIVTKPGGEKDIGTCFLLGNQCTLVTARHVIENKSRIEIPTHDGTILNIRKILISEDHNLDVAFILTDKLLTNSPYFRLSESHILDEVLCLGFPPIPGFEAILIADLATVNSEIKASAGRVVASSNSYLDKQRYYLINARVKGGNSGGPIVNRQGYVVGILVHTPINSEDSKKLDSLGYGVATPTSEWASLLRNSESGKSSGIELPFENIQGGGFRTDI